MFDAPVPAVIPVHDGVNDVNVLIALSSAAVSTCPAVNVPSVAMSNHHPNLLVSRIPSVDESNVKN